MAQAGRIHPSFAGWMAGPPLASQGLSGRTPDWSSPAFREMAKRIGFSEAEITQLERLYRMQDRDR